MMLEAGTDDKGRCAWRGASTASPRNLRRSAGRNLTGARGIARILHRRLLLGAARAASGPMRARDRAAPISVPTCQRFMPGLTKLSGSDDRAQFDRHAAAPSDR